MEYLYVVGGLALLFAGGEGLVRGAVTLSRRMGLSSLLIGLTVVGFGTSSPELMVSVGAAVSGETDIAVGNVVGSNIANILLILGLSALVAPIVVKPLAVRRDLVVMIAASALLTALALTGAIERWHGALMFAVLVAYVSYSYWSEIRQGGPSAELHAAEAAEFPEKGQNAGVAIVMVLAALVALVLGAQLLVDGSTSIARAFGIPEAVIGLTLVAVGTSLPELATSLIAAARGHTDVAVGNIVGSNVFNILSILGITAMLGALPISPGIASFDVWVMLAVGVSFAALVLWRGRIGRPCGALMLGLYVAYSAVLYAGIAGAGAL